MLKNEKKGDKYKQKDLHDAKLNNEDITKLLEKDQSYIIIIFRITYRRGKKNC